MFGFGKKNEMIGSPIKGKVIKCADIPDESFAQEMIGKGVGIEPSDGKIYAPCDGVINMVFDTKHAIGLTSAQGTELLIHVGIDTVNLKGEPFNVLVSVDEKVTKGQLLMEADLEKIKAAGLSTITPLLVCNADDFKDIKRVNIGNYVDASTDVIEIIR